MRRVGVLVALSCAVLAAGAPRPAAGEAIEIKIATLAPAGSFWAKRMERGAKELLKRTDGRVKFKYFFGGQQGDERDVVAKMDLGQLDGAALTAVGLGLIRSDVRVLELPFLFRSYEEIDHVRGAMESEFDKMFADAGYVLLNWGDVGWVHTFSAKPFSSLAEFKKLKIWLWQDDPIARAFQKKLGLNSVPLGVPEVLGALGTGVIDVCYGPPLAAIALQWYTKLKYVTSTPSSFAIGAVLVRKDVWEKLDPRDRETISAAFKAERKAATQAFRKDAERAKKALEGAGLKFIDVPEDVRRAMEQQAQEVWNELASKVYPKALLDRVLALIKEVRK